MSTLLSPPQAAPAQPTLWRHQDFLRLWFGQTVALFGEQITLLALPLTAITMLHAGPGQLGLLNAVQFLPIAVVTLIAGVLADRVRRRPLLIIGNIGRTITLALVPIAFLTGQLTMGLLYLVAFVTGAFTAQFDVAYQSYLPAVVKPEQLIDANSKLQSSASVSQAAGLGAGGLIVQLLTAPVAIAVNSVGYFISVTALTRIRTPEPAPTDTGRSVLADLREGLQITWSDRLLRSVMLQSACFNFFWDIVLVLMPWHVVTGLGLPTAVLGPLIAGGSLGALVGSVLAPKIGQRWGAGRAMGMGMVLGSVVLILLPIASGPAPMALLLMAIAYIGNGLGMVLFNIHSMSLRQSRVPTQLLGRVSATYRCVAFIVIPLGGLAAAVLAATTGGRTALVVAAAGLTVGAMLFSRLRVVREAT
ncbi:MFS transporter [Flexivirga meconopsidis]|uniref:MFS transporter n=1 Tax=Flexivirga meconopsidis TaxID=2977121 RepID=UPI0022400E45|nr:MFS transporter [Flexivirga meconopsidis]